MKTRHGWMEPQLVEHKTKPVSGLGKAIQREAQDPLDNNIVEGHSICRRLHRLCTT
jgi:hypothetical protein